MPVPFALHGYRPEHTHKHYHAVAPLRTCSRIYLEARLILASTATQDLWNCWYDHAPLEEASVPRFQDMIPEQLVVVESLLIYAQKCELEHLHGAFTIPELEIFSDKLRIHHLTVTVRHGDWWNWEEDEPLWLDGDENYEPWCTQFARIFPDLEAFKFKLETLERLRPEMDALVINVRRWRISLREDVELSAQGQPVHRRTWDGFSEFSGVVPAPEGADTLPYHVVTICWQPRLIERRQSTSQSFHIAEGYARSGGSLF